MATTEKCTKCGVKIQQFTMCTKCYMRYTRATKKRGTVDYQDYVNINSTPEERLIYDIGNIWANQVECLDCGDLIRSVNRHDYKHCSCKKTFVDGGSWYCRSNSNSVSRCIPFTYPHKEQSIGESIF